MHFRGLLLTITFFVSLLWSEEAAASHLKGGDTYFKCVGNGSYQLVFSCYYACDAASQRYDSVASHFGWLVTSSCGGVPTYIVAATATAVADVPLYCHNIRTTCDYSPYSSAPTNTPSGTLVITYTSAPFSIPAGCYLTATVDVANRNANISNLSTPSSYTFDIQTTITTPLDSSCNSNPTFAQYPVDIFCLGTPANFTQGAISPNGDSLSYTLINPRATAGGPVPFVPGCSPGDPLGTSSGLGFASSFSFDSTTGNVNFVPTATGNYVMTIQVNDYHNGVLVGTTMRDIQFTVTICNGVNHPPVLTNLFSLSNVSGGIIVDSTHIAICPGQPLNIVLKATDPDAFNYVQDSSNSILSLPGSTYYITHSGSTLDTAVYHISWTPTAADSGFHYFSLNIQDTFCPNPGRNTYSFIVSVYAGLYAGANQVYCNTGQPVTIYANGANHYLWTDSATGGTPVGVTGYGPDSSYIIVAPPVTTGYVVKGDLLGGCKNRDTVTVVNAPIFTLHATSQDSSVCRNSTTLLTAMTNPASVGPYTYVWSPATMVVSPSSATTVIVPLTGPTVYTVKVTNASGCTLRDSVEVSIKGGSPVIVLTASNNNVCPGDTVNLSTQVYAVSLVSCGIVDTCPNNTVLVSHAISSDTSSTSGIGTTTSVYGSPFMGNRHSFRAQYLFTRQELNAAGISSGAITDISFFVKKINSTNGYVNLTVSMGCTNADSLTGFVNNLQEVMPPLSGGASFYPNQGWSPLVLTHFFNWDGSSNLIIQVCYTNPVGTFSFDDFVSYTTTTNHSAIVAGQNSNTLIDGCTLGQSSNLYRLLYTRPNVRFGQCLPVSTTHYQWSPTTLVCDTCDSTRVIVNQDKTYTLTVTSGINGACPGDTSIILTVNRNISVYATPTDTILCGGRDAVQLQSGMSNPVTPQCQLNYQIDSIGYAPINGVDTLVPPISYVDAYGFNYSTDDGTAGPYQIGFNFPFYCQQYTKFYVNSNGWISFVNPNPATTSIQQSTAQTLPTTIAANLNPQKFIALMMGNYWLSDSQGNGGGHISYFVSGATPNRVLVVKFTNMADESLRDSASGEMHMYESTGVIELLLRSSDYSGVNHTTGIKDSTGIGQAAPGRNNQPYAISRPEAWRFTPQYHEEVAVTGTHWSSGQYLTADDIANPIATTPVSQTFYLTDTLVINQYTHPSRCIVRDSVHIRIKVPVPTVIAMSPSAVCPGGEGQIKLHSTDTIVSYHWTPSTGLSDSTIAQPTLILTDTSIYYLSTVNNYGCAYIDTIQLNTAPVPLVNLPPSFAICQCQPNIDLIPAVSGGTPTYHYHWSDGTSGGTNTDANAGSTSYTLTVTDANGCTAVSNTDTVTARCPVAEISVAPSDTLLLKGSAQITTNGSRGYTYVWTGNSNAQITSPTSASTGVVGQQIGVDTIHVLVTDSNLCTYTTTQVIYIIDTPVIYHIDSGRFELPTAFSPNGDGKNEHFYPALKGSSDEIRVTAFKIYNRWGQLVYDDPNAPGWDGSFTSQQQPADVYLYFVTIEVSDSADPTRVVTKSMQGTINLFR